ncbi:MAG: phosphopantothenoylcysteine decarboxylase [Candidatus Omnitrophica bacterium]|nr:phosphopantothenoylcysteine decarboxylase [Candidatus Omnitrophota bacterium]
MSLKNKRVLVTAGPTWVPIDAVRVISNTASGETGNMLARELGRRGARVTLLMGPAPVGREKVKEARVVAFRFFDELKKELFSRLRSGRYDILIHAAAVSDYRLKYPLSGKVDSGKRALTLTLVPTEKLILSAKKLGKKIFVVGFKFEPHAGRRKLIREAATLLVKGACDMVVANTFTAGRYRAYIVRQDTVRGPFTDKKGLARALAKQL